MVSALHAAKAIQKLQENMDSYIYKEQGKIPDGVINIIKLCWDRDSNVRPSAPALVLLLSQAEKQQQVLDNQSITNMLIQLAEDKVYCTLTLKIFCRTTSCKQVKHECLIGQLQNELVTDFIVMNSSFLKVFI